MSWESIGKKRKKLFTVFVPILRVRLNMRRGRRGGGGDVHMPHTWLISGGLSKTVTGCDVIVVCSSTPLTQDTVTLTSDP
jgi:hypothetical protein